MGKWQNEGKSWKMMLGQSNGWVETNPGCRLVSLGLSTKVG